MVTETSPDPKEDKQGTPSESFFDNDEGKEEEYQESLAVDTASDEEAPAASEPTPEPVLEAPQPEPIAPAPAPVAPSPPVPSPAEVMLRQQNQAYQQQLAQYAQQQREVQVEEQIRRDQEEWTRQGILPEQAAAIAQKQQQTYNQLYQYQQAAEQSAQNERGRFNAALHYAKQYGVDAEALYQFDSPEAMEASAKQEQRIKQLEAQAASAKKATVPAQSFASNQAPARTPSGRTKRLEILGEKENLSETELEELENLTRSG